MHAGYRVGQGLAQVTRSARRVDRARRDAVAVVRRYPIRESPRIRSSRHRRRFDTSRSGIPGSEDLEVGLRSRCAASVAKGGSLTLPAKKLYEIIKALPEIEPVGGDFDAVLVFLDQFYFVSIRISM